MDESKVEICSTDEYRNLIDQRLDFPCFNPNQMDDRPNPSMPVIRDLQLLWSCGIEGAELRANSFHL